MSMIDIDKFIASILSNPSIEGTQLYHCIDKAIGEQGCMVHNGELVEVVVSPDMVEQKPIDPDIQKIIDCHFDEMLDEPNKENLHSYLYGAEEFSGFKSKLCGFLQHFRFYKEDVPTNGDIIDYIEERSEELLSAARKQILEEIEEALLSEVLPCFMHGGEADEVIAKLEEVLEE